MGEREAALCSMAEFRARAEGAERQEQRRWERIRWQVWQMMMPNFKKGHAPKSAKAFCRFPWEKTSEQEAREGLERSRVSAEEAAVLDKLFKDLEERKQNGKDR